MALVLYRQARRALSNRNSFASQPIRASTLSTNLACALALRSFSLMGSTCRAITCGSAAQWKSAPIAAGPAVLSAL